MVLSSMTCSLPRIDHASVDPGDRSRPRRQEHRNESGQPDERDRLRSSTSGRGTKNRAGPFSSAKRRSTVRTAASGLEKIARSWKRRRPNSPRARSDSPARQRAELRQGLSLTNRPATWRLGFAVGKSGCAGSHTRRRLLYNPHRKANHAREDHPPRSRRGGNRRRLHKRGRLPSGSTRSVRDQNQCQPSHRTPGTDRPALRSTKGVASSPRPGLVAIST